MPLPTKSHRTFGCCREAGRLPVGPAEVDAAGVAWSRSYSEIIHVNGGGVTEDESEEPQGIGLPLLKGLRTETPR